MSKEQGTKEERSFTEALTALQEAANAIGRQTTSLEESIHLFEEGMKDAAYCSEILEKAEQKFEVYRAETEGEAHADL